QDYSELGNLDLLLNSQSLSYETISAILRQVINGLEFLHSQHLLHWHLVPQNILMFRRPDGEYVPKITDFGASSILHIGPACDSIPFYLNEIIGDAWIFSGKAMSHYYFESPEKLKQKPLTLNTDLWSFGVIAYRAFTGHLPFTTGDEDSASEAGKIELFCQIAAGEVPDGINKIIEPWKSLILKCLVVDPTKRIQSARECLNFLDTWGDTIRPVGVTRVFYPDPPQAPIANLDEFHNRYQYDPRTHKIGSGGFGDVFKAQDTNNDTLVAIKISKVEHEKIRLRKEVEMADALPNHENIAMYFGCYSFDTPMGEYDFAVLDYYSLGNLNQFLNNHSLSYENIGLILRQVLNGLDFLYSQKIIHQDLKPQNILIDIKPDGKYVPKIIDFGISRKQLFFHKEGQAYSVVMADPGPLAYTSPEQQKDEVIRQNTALWSFGLIACQVFADMGASHRPLRRILGLISKGIIPEIINKIIEPWRSLILKCLVVDPTKRIQSAKECLDFLDTWGDTIRPSGVARAFYPEPPPDEDPPAGSHSSYSGDTIIDVSLQPRIDEKPFSEGRHTKTQISPKPTAPPERNHTNDDAEKTEPYATTLCPPPQFGQTESYCVVCSREVPEGSQLCHEHIDVPLINPLIAELSKGIYEYPNNPSLYLSRSYAFANIGYYSRAIEDCNDVIRLSPEKADGHIARGSTLLKMGDFDSAIRAFDEAILLEPNSSVAYEERGKAYSHKGDSKRAEENYEKARWLRYLGR
ncbi:MAG: protein kinase, partial [Holophagaceae bacterium]|nr:protein kinase [Holophagaceae bacterium]